MKTFFILLIVYWFFVLPGYANQKQQQINERIKQIQQDTLEIQRKIDNQQEKDYNNYVLKKLKEIKKEEKKSK